LTMDAVIIGDLLVLGVDGYLHKADNTGIAAEYVALSSGAANELIEVNSKGILNKEMAFPDASLLFLGTAGGYTNIPPTATGTISQLIGTYNATNKTLTYNIGDWYIAE